MSERYTDQSEIFDKLKENPPKVILVFDNWRGSKKEALKKADLTMELRANLAAQLYHNIDLFPTEDTKPQLICFAARHKPGYKPGSFEVKNQLMKYQIPENKITVMENTLTMTQDISRLHWYLKHNGLESGQSFTQSRTSAVIVATSDVVERTKHEVINHIQKHRNHAVWSRFFIAGPSSINTAFRNTFGSAQFINYLEEKEVEFLDLEEKGYFSGGAEEKAALLLAKSKILRSLGFQSLAERISHPGLLKIERQRSCAKAMQKAGSKLKRKRVISKLANKITKYPKNFKPIKKFIPEFNHQKITGIYKDEKKSAEIRKNLKG